MIEAYVWVAYSRQPPYLPCACADSSEGLAQLLGVSRGTVLAMWYRYQHGKVKRSRYHKVLIEEVEM